ncbi:MAG: phospholipase [Muribaculaceae bacterium]|nr:phospholipase [Muribaculaceae bacterium]
MTGALIILAALVIVGGVLYLFHRRDIRRGRAQAPSMPPIADMPAGGDDDDSPCCGMHITCEKDSLLAQVSETIEYFDDEELDAYRGRDAESYSDEETEQFRDVLLTLLPEDIAPWALSIQLRGITLPGCVREELLMIVAEERLKHK